MLTREQFDKLEYGDILVCNEDEFKVNHVVNDVAFIINKYNTVYHHSFWELKEFSFKTEPKYNGKAVKCDSVEQDNPIVSANDSIKTPQYYDNSNGSLYLFAEQQNLNSWEFDLVKRIVRCRKKGNFKEDLEKSKTLIDLYLKEYGTNN